MSWVANPRSRLFETDRVEASLVAVFEAQGLPAQRKFQPDTNTTPRIEFDLETTGMTGNRFALNNSGGSQFCPFNVWKFNLAVSIITNRQTNGDSHQPLCGIVRWAMTMNQLDPRFTEAVSPVYEMLEMREEGTDASTKNDQGNQITTINFIGMFGIRDSAWQNG